MITYIEAWMKLGIGFAYAGLICALIFGVICLFLVIDDLDSYRIYKGSGNMHQYDTKKLMSFKMHDEHFYRYNEDEAWMSFWVHLILGIILITLFITLLPLVMTLG